MKKLFIILGILLFLFVIFVLIRGGGSNQSLPNVAKSQIEVTVYDDTGNSVAKEELSPQFFDTGVVTGVFPLDLDYNAIAWGVADVTNGTVTLSEKVNKPFILHFYPKVEGFGQVKVYADNGGVGFPVGASKIDMPKEAVKSRLRKVDEEIAKAPQGSITAEAKARLASAKNHFALATKTKTTDPKEIYEALRDSLWAGEIAVLDRAHAEIKARGHRTGFLLGGALSPEFDKWDANKQKLFKDLFNFATLKSFFIKGYEQEKGKTRPEESEAQLSWIEQQGIVAKGHPLVYLIDPNTPGWLKGADFKTIEKAMEDRIVREVTRFKGRIKFWDVTNELNNPQAEYTQTKLVELTKIAVNAVKQTDPAAKAIININMPTGDILEYTPAGQAAMADRAQTSFQYLTALTKSGVSFDVVGIQMYYPALDMLEISRLLDRYAKLGKPIHISEIGVSSQDGVDKKSYFKDQKATAALGQWHSPWNETIQADWLEQLYTIAYAKSSVEAITYWDLTDDFWPYGGIVRSDGTPKEAYQRLNQLLASWGF